MLFGGETAQSYYEEGPTAAMKGDLPLALARFRRALELDVQLHNARYQIGKCLLRMGQAGEALEHLEKVSKHLMMTQPLVDAGYALLLLNRVEEARQKFSDALQLKPEDARAILGLARCAVAKDQWETAMNLAQHVLQSGYAHFDSHFLIACSADNCGLPETAAANYEKALELMERTIDANPDQPAGYFLRGKVYFFQGNNKAALEDFEAALTKADANAHYAAYHEHFTVLDMLCIKGLTLHKLGRREEAQAVGKRILELAPDNETGKDLAAGATGKGNP